MPEIDTSMNRDPSPTAAELLALRDAAMERLESGRPVRIIRSANLRTTAWRQDADSLGRSWRGLGVPSRDSNRCHSLAETGEHLGLERVGLIVETVEVSR